MSDATAGLGSVAALNQGNSHTADLGNSRISLKARPPLRNTTEQGRWA